MLKSVLSKLVECMDTHNHYVLQGPPVVANHYISKCDLLIECLENAGYKVEFDTEPLEIAEGMYRGCRGSLYTCLKIYMPTDGSYIRTYRTVEEFKEIGFEQMLINGIYHKFETTRKEEAV